jgi:methyl-accepting chemotaxis protein
MVTRMMVFVIALLSFILLNRASSTQMATALESQERLAAEQARIIQMRYEFYLRTAGALADTLVDFDAANTGRQRNRFEQLMKSIIISEERAVGTFAVFKPDTIDPGMDALFAGEPGGTESGQWAPWYTRQTGNIEFLTFNDVPAMMNIINGPDARRETIDNPVLQMVAGRNTYVAKVSVPVIHRRTNEVIGRVGINVNTAYTQPEEDKRFDR